MQGTVRRRSALDARRRGLLEAEQQFRKIIGYSDLARLALAVEHDLTARRSPRTAPTTPERADTLVSV